MRRRDWSELREDFRAVVYERGAESVATRMHVHKTTVYRLINGTHARPQGAVRAAIEEVVANATNPGGTVGGENPSR